jgi:endonuclease/exonuclease/phosphatase family metal-dependent hydrolase
VNAWQHLNPNVQLPQTLRWSREQATAYHCDAIFIDQRLLSLVRSASVMTDAAWHLLTDHNPIVLELA